MVVNNARQGSVGNERFELARAAAPAFAFDRRFASEIGAAHCPPRLCLGTLLRRSDRHDLLRNFAKSLMTRFLAPVSDSG